MSPVELFIQNDCPVFPVLSSQKRTVMEQISAQLAGGIPWSHPPLIPKAFTAVMADSLRTARHPLLIIDYTEISAFAREAVCHFSEELRIPVLCTAAAKGIIPCDHRYAIGTLGSTPEFQTLIDSSDLILVLGGSEHTRTLHAACPVLSLDVTQNSSSDFLPDMLHQLCILCRPKMPPLFAIRIKKAHFQRQMAEGCNMSFPMLPEKIMFDVRYVLALNDILVADPLAEAWAAAYFDCYQPNTCLFTHAHGTAVIGALSAKLSKPGRRVIAVVKSDSLCSADFDLIQQLHAPIVVLAVHDSEKPVATVPCPNALSTTICSASELIPRLQWALQSGQATVVHCPLQF